MKKASFIQSVKETLGVDFLEKKELKILEKTGTLVAVRRDTNGDAYYLFATDGNKRQPYLICGMFNDNSYHYVPSEFGFANVEQATNVKPTNRVGVELEFSSSTKRIYFYSDFFTLESDSSVHSSGHRYGVEIVTTILDRHDLLNLNHPLYTLAESLRKFQDFTTIKAGAGIHLHIDSSFPIMKAAKAMAYISRNTEIFFEMFGRKSIYGMNESTITAWGQSLGIALNSAEGDIIAAAKLVKLNERTIKGLVNSTASVILKKRGSHVDCPFTFSNSGNTFEIRTGKAVLKREILANRVANMILCSLGCYRVGNRIEAIGARFDSNGKSLLTRGERSKLDVLFDSMNE